MKKPILTRDEKRAIPFILPGIIVTALLIVYPLIYIFSMSFTDQSSGGSFSGLYNYLRLFKNPQFMKTVSNTLKWTLSTVVFSFLLGCAYAMLIHRKGIKGKGFGAA